MSIKPSSEKPKVILRRVPEYDPVGIFQAVREGIEAVGMSGRVRGRVTIKPNVVMSHPKVTPSAFTRPEFMDGLLRALRSFSDGDLRLTISEKCGVGIPTSRMFRRAGYYKLRRMHPVRVRPIEESAKRKVRLERGVVHRTITTAPEILDNDLLVYAPKLKTNSLAHGLTASLKLNIGIFRDRERMRNHNFNLDDKIVDALEVGYPGLIVTDAIEVSTGGNHLTQHGRPLGLVLVSNHPLAHDVVAAHIFHLDPRAIGHLAKASERGYGSLDLADIDIGGDITLDEVRERTTGWEVGFIPVDRVDGNIRVMSGTPYCTGGCHGVFLDWLYMIKDRKPQLWPKLPRWTAVIGEYEGDVAADRLLLVGTCTKVKGRTKARRVVRIRGCPPKHKNIVLWMFLRAGIVNPLFRLDLIFDSYVCLFFSWIRRFVRGRL
jgi:uncharacterized protein (DUF362 family)